MDERTKGNKFAMQKLQEAFEKRNDLINRQKDDQVKIGMHEQEANFIRAQRVRSYEEAVKYLKPQSSVAGAELPPMDEVLENAQKIFEFFVAEGIYQLHESNLVKL